MSYVSHDGLAYFKHKLDQKFISNITSEDGALKIVLGDGTVLKSIQDTTVTQKKSTANELYPLLLCYDAMADQDQLSKETWFGQHILANPYYGYLASRGMYVKHPTFNRRNGVSQKVEWAYDFTDAVSGLGNPMSQVYAYVDPASEGGEHCIELRLYGNPNVSPTVPSINDSTNTFSIGVGVTGGNVQFGYCPSTPLYLDDGSTLRTEATGHGNDIITRDWLNRNGSLTGLVHTTMDEAIDGAKTFKKTVTINSGDNNNKANLYVQGNSDVHGNEHVYGTETVDGKLTANSTAEIKGGSGNTPSLTVTGDERVTGNSSVDGNSSITGNETVSGKITGNNGAEINGGNGLIVNGNETVNGEIYKLINNTPQEYVSYVTNKQETKTTIVNNLIKDKGGLAADANKNIYVDTGRGLAIDSAGKINVDFTQMPTSDITNVVTGMVAPGSGLVADSSTGKLAVDFNQMPTAKFEALLASLKMLVPLTSNLLILVSKDHVNASDTLDEGRGAGDKPFKTITAAVNYVTSKYSLGNYSVAIIVAHSTQPYVEHILLPSFSHGTGIITIQAQDFQNPPTITNAAGHAVVMQVIGGTWRLIRLNIVGSFGTPGNTNIPNTFYGMAVSQNAAVYMQGCHIKAEYLGTATTTHTEVRALSVDSATMYIEPIEGYPTIFECYQNNATAANLLYTHLSSSLHLLFTNIESDVTDTYKVYLAGDVTTVTFCGGGSKIDITGSGNHAPHFYVLPDHTVTGRKYWCTSGGAIEAVSGGFPGTIDGVVDEASYSWYRELTY